MQSYLADAFSKSSGGETFTFSRCFFFFFFLALTTINPPASPTLTDFSTRLLAAAAEAGGGSLWPTSCDYGAMTPSLKKKGQKSRTCVFAGYQVHWVTGSSPGSPQVVFGRRARGSEFRRWQVQSGRQQWRRKRGVGEGAKVKRREIFRTIYA